MLINLKDVKSIAERAEVICRVRNFHIWAWTKIDDGTYSKELQSLYVLMEELEKTNIGRKYNIFNDLLSKTESLIKKTTNPKLKNVLGNFLIAIKER